MMRTILAIAAAILLVPIWQPTVTAQVSAGIHVRGQWEITIRDIDGAIVRRYEFDNALVPNGVTLLMNAMLRRFSMGPWAVVLSGSSDPLDATGPCGYGCLVAQPLAGTFENESLTATRNGSGPLVLSGSVRATQAGVVGSVGTLVLACTSTVSPSECVAGTGALWPFTQHSLQTPIQVAANQLIEVTVRISFS